MTAGGGAGKRELLRRPGYSSRRDGRQESRGGAGPPAAAAWRAAAPGRGHRPICWRRLRLPGPGYLGPRRAVANNGCLTQYAGRILRSQENKTTAEVHDYLDERTGVLAAMLAKRAPGYTGLGFPDPRKLTLTPSVGTASSPASQAP